MIVQFRKDQPAIDLETSKSQPQCRLLSLPAELRNHIWQFILVHNTKSAALLPAHLFPGAPASARKTSRFCANVLLTCKQINAEGTPILYGENTFSAHSSLLASLPCFLLLERPNKLLLGPVKSQRMQKLIRRYSLFLRLDTDPQFTKRLAEESFTGAEELRIDVFQAMYASSDFSVLRLFEGVRGIGKVNIDGSLGDGKYAEWLTNTMMLPEGAETMPYSEQYVGGVKAWDSWTSGNR